MNYFLLIFVIFATLIYRGKAESVDENDIPELRYLDESVDPCDNFYEFSCGNFGKYHEISGDNDHFDNFAQLEEELIILTQEMLSAAKQSDDPTAVKKAKSAYQGCVAEQNIYLTTPEFKVIEEAGGFPILEVERTNFEFSWKQISELIGRHGIQLFFDITVTQLYREEIFLLFFQAPGDEINLFRPMKPSYDEILEESFRESVKNFNGPERLLRNTPLEHFWKNLLQHLLHKQNISKDLTKELSDVVSFTQQLYSIYPQVVYPYTVSEVQNLINSNTTVDINWKEFLNGFFNLAGVNITDHTLVFLDFEFVKQILNLVQQTDPKVVKNFALLRILFFLSPDSDTDIRAFFDRYYFETYGKKLPRVDYCTRKILDFVDPAGLSFAIAHDYQRYHVNINKLKAAAEMAQSIQEAFKEILEGLEWMDEESRGRALKKVDNIYMLLAYPEFVSDKEELDKFYENVRICEWDHYGNSQRIRAFRRAYKNSMIGLADVREYWTVSPMTVNAFYNKQNNRFFLPIAMLSEPFFPNSQLLSFARLGSVIGHEMTHGFDSDGNMYDENGSLGNGWTNATAQAFNDKKVCFEEQYSRYSLPEYNYTIDGKKTFNENLADNGGIKQSYRAFKKLVDSGTITGADSNKYTVEQLFFIGYGTMWCSLDSQDWLDYLKASTYSATRFRTLGSLTNFKDFSEAFNCPVGSNMNPIEEKCVIW